MHEGACDKASQCQEDEITTIILILTTKAIVLICYLDLILLT